MSDESVPQVPTDDDELSIEDLSLVVGGVIRNPTPGTNGGTMYTLDYVNGTPH